MKYNFLILKSILFSSLFTILFSIPFLVNAYTDLNSLSTISKTSINDIMTTINTDQKLYFDKNNKYETLDTITDNNQKIRIDTFTNLNTKGYITHIEDEMKIIEIYNDTDNFYKEIVNLKTDYSTSTKP